MTRRTVLALFVVALLSAPPVAAARTGSCFTAETNVQLAAGPFGVYLSGEPNVVWRPSWFGLGAGVKLIAGVTQFDVGVAPFARAELGWFYANAGWAVELADRAETYRAVDDGWYFAAGIAPDFLPFAAGRLGVDLGLEVYRPIAGDALEYPVGSLVATWGLPGPLSEFTASILGNTLLRLGLLYTFAL